MHSASIKQSLHCNSRMLSCFYCCPYLHLLASSSGRGLLSSLRLPFLVALGAALGMATTAAGHLCCWLVRSWCPAGSQPSLGASSQARHNSPATSLLTRVVTDSLFVDSCLMPPVFGETTVIRALSCQQLKLSTHGC